jgi:hypothetical protein
MKVASFKAKRKHGYCNKWFGGKLPSTARRALKRWTEMKFPKNMKICGNIYGHYFNFKIANAIHVTKRQGKTDFFDTYTRNGYNVLKDIFREKFLDVIKKEVSKAEKPSWVRPVVSHDQVKVSLLKSRLEKSVNNGGCTFLHNFLSVVVAGTFPKKKFFEVARLKTNVSAKHKWKPCVFHTDIGDPPEDYLDNEKSPVTLYFAIEKKVLQLDLIPKAQKTGPKPKAKTVRLNPGDVLLFDTCRIQHRTSAPIEGICPERVNIVVVGFENYLDMEADSGSSGSE